MNEKKLNIIKGTLYGVAVGDALGAPVEFMGAESIEQQHGRVTEMIGGGWLNVRPGEVTDDTQMTLCVARGVVRNGDGDLNGAVREVGAEFIKWINSRPKDVGGTCSASIHGAIERGRKTGREDKPTASNWMQASAMTDKSFGGKSAGNGSLMRTAFIPLYYTDDRQMKKAAEEISRMTHYDRIAAEACVLYCQIISGALRCKGGIFDRLNVYEKAIQNSTEYAEALDKGFIPRPSGYSVDSLKAAIWAIETAEDHGTTRTFFREAVQYAVNLGGDADTIGAITGGLIGAICGYDSIPQSWIDALSDSTKAELNELAEAAAARWEEAASELDPEAEP